MSLRSALLMSGRDFARSVFHFIIFGILCSLILHGPAHGATTVIEENFEGTVTGWNDNTVENGGSTYTKFLGRNNGTGSTASQQVYKTFTIPTTATEVTVEFDFYEIGQWENKQFRIYVNDQQTGQGTFSYHCCNLNTGNANFTPLNSSTYNGEVLQRYRFSKTISVAGNSGTIKIGFGAPSLITYVDFGEGTATFYGWWGVDNLKLTASSPDPVIGSISIEKALSGNSTTFNYTTTGTGLSNFSLTPATNGAANQNFTGLSAGTYTITESEVSGYPLTSLTCTGDTDGGNVINLATRTVTIDLDANENQTCTFSGVEQVGSGSGGGGTGGEVSLPVGTTSAKFGVTPGGSANYTIPLAVPKGTAGLQPALAMEYNSQDRNNILGVGWRVTGLSYINRCETNLYVDDPAKGGIGIDPVDYDDNDQFCLNGERLVAVNGTHGADGTEYHTFFEEFSKVVSNGNTGNGPTSFTVYKKTGEILTYGGTEDSRFRRLVQDHVRTWALSKQADAKGNYIAYSYHNDRTNGEFYINSVQYTGNDAQGLVSYNRVDFLYEDRSDKIGNYKSGDEIILTKRINKIQVFSESQLAHEYRIAYGVGDTGLSRVESITECANETTCFKPTTFKWNNGVLAPTQSSYNKISQPDIYASPMPFIHSFLDFDGDGYQDILHYIRGIGNENDGNGPTFAVARNKGNGQFEHNSSYVLERIPTESVHKGDFNGDGKTDLAHAGDHNRLYVKLSNGNGAFNTLEFASGKRIITVGDFDGDGRSDILLAEGFSGDEKSGLLTTQQHYLLISNGDGTFTTKTVPLSEMVPDGFYGVQLVGDFNGDGRSDLYLFNNQSNFYPRVLSGGDGGDKVMLSKGDGTFSVIAIPSDNAVPSYHKISGSGDFNGDGLTDFYTAKYCESSNTACNEETVWFSKGDGTFTKKAVSNFNQINAFVYNVSVLPDTNGDGYADLYIFGLIQNPETGFYEDVGGAVFLGNGDGTFRKSLTIPAAGTVYFFGLSGQTLYGFAGVADMNGDGLTDIVYASPFAINLDYSGVMQIPTLHLSPFLSPEKITRVTNGHELSTDISYKHLTDSSVYTKGTTAQFPVQNTISPREVVSEVKMDNATGGQNA